MSRLSFIIIFLLAALTQSYFLKAGYQQIERSMYYAALRSDNVDKINTQIQMLQKMKGPLIPAFMGTLMMKKAGLLKDPKQKLELFKEGRSAIDSLISSQPMNAELRYLRLIIQENAPKILGYHQQKKEDAALIVKLFKNLPEILKKEILNYSLNSKVLKQEDLKAHE